ncbi:hypothetical protein DFH09DRAFT_1090035 [Mycena vulgaris]|nr:hypothetical protein DFH09DRAFT_1090035 [Mycena vulgaris]
MLTPDIILLAAGRIRVLLVLLQLLRLCHLSGLDMQEKQARECVMRSGGCTRCIQCHRPWWQQGSTRNPEAAWRRRDNPNRIRALGHGRTRTQGPPSLGWRAPEQPKRGTKAKGRAGREKILRGQCTSKAEEFLARACESGGEEAIGGSVIGFFPITERRRKGNPFIHFASNLSYTQAGSQAHLACANS